MNDTLAKTAISSLVLCTDYRNSKTIDDSEVLGVGRARDTFLDGLDHSAFDGQLDFATANGKPTHKHWLAAAACLAAPARFELPENDILRARIILVRIHALFYGPLSRCEKCIPVCADREHWGHLGASLMRGTDPETRLPDAPDDSAEEANFLARLHLLLRAENWNRPSAETSTEGI